MQAEPDEVLFQDYKFIYEGRKTNSIDLTQWLISKIVPTVDKELDKLNQDLLFPILFDGNLYKYANNNPVNFTDPLGLWFGSAASYGGGGGSWQGTWGTWLDFFRK